MKEKIIEILHNALPGEPLSGVDIGEQLGISRVAVWKHLKQLKESGYEVISTPKGYLLQGAKDVLMPLFFTKRKGQIHFFETISSTMDKARELARNGAPNFSIVIAEEQTKGRGRLNRTWLSDRGGLWFTMILRPNLPPPLAFQVNFAASLSLSRTLKTMYGLDVSVKWPNDILLKERQVLNRTTRKATREGKIIAPFDHQESTGLPVERKLAGLLSEMETQGDMLSFVNIGIGLNVNNAPETDEPNAVSIKTALGKKVCRRDLLSAFLDDFENLLIETQSMQTHSARLMEQWKQMTSTIGRHVQIKTFGDIYEGFAIDVDQTGALIIIQENGIEKKIIYGDCFHSSYATN